MDASASMKRIVILGGGFGGVATAHHLERLCRRLRLMIDRTFALLFRPDVVKVGLDSETALLLREVALADAAAGPREEGGGRTDSAADGSPLGLARPEVLRPKPARI
jgi:hypothetical protein